MTGGGTQLLGLVDVAKRRLRLPVRLGRAKELGGIGDQVSGPEFAVALGLIAWATGQEASGGGGKKRSMHVPDMGKSVERVRNWVKAFWP